MAGEGELADGQGAARRPTGELSDDERRLAAAARGARREGARRTRGWGEDGPRDHVVKVRFSDQELAEVQTVASRLGRAPASWIADLATRFARGQLGAIPASERDLIAEYLRLRVDVVRAGTVINQVARHANATGEFAEDTERLLEFSERLLSRIDDATARANERVGRAR